MRWCILSHVSSRFSTRFMMDNHGPMTWRTGRAIRRARSWVRLVEKPICSWGQNRKWHWSVGKFTSVSRGNPWQMMQCKDVRELADLCDRFLLHPETLFGDLFQKLETCCYWCRFWHGVRLNTRNLFERRTFLLRSTCESPQTDLNLWGLSSTQRMWSFTSAVADFAENAVDFLFFWNQVG